MADSLVSGLYFKSPGNPVPHCYQYAYKENVEGPLQDTHMYSALVDPIARFLFKHTDAIKAGPESLVLPSTKDDLVECDGVGGGCLLVHRQVLDAIEPPWFEYNKGTFVGEDFYFCRKAQEAGFKIYADPSVLVGHYSEYLRGWRHFLQWTDNEPSEWKAE
jgi:GT2 family glycosyltransferase